MQKKHSKEFKREAVSLMNHRLRKQLAKSERINEILKKTVGYFSKEES